MELLHIGERIRAARAAAGFSLRELANAIDNKVSHTALAKYEKGELMPDSRLLLLLAKALQVKTDYFLRKPNVAISGIEFRKKSALTEKKINAIRYQITDSIEKYIALEGLLNIPTNFTNPIADRQITNGDDVEEAVIDLLHAWDLGSNAIPNVMELLESKEVKVVEIAADEKFDGLSGWANGAIPVIVVNGNFTIERKRFTALHELGHLLLNFSEPDGTTIEQLCHRFAGAMLLPRQTCYKELGEHRKNIAPKELALISETYGISAQAIMARAKDLGIISNEYFVGFWKRMNANEKYKEAINRSVFLGREHSVRFNQLVYRAVAEEIITMSKAADFTNQKLAAFRDEYMTI